jgi:hypothetical protein
MLSGICPAAHLAEHGIDVVVDLPGVGQGLQDHPTVVVPWALREAVSAADEAGEDPQQVTISCAAARCPPAGKPWPPSPSPDHTSMLPPGRTCTCAPRWWTGPTRSTPPTPPLRSAWSPWSTPPAGVRSCWLRPIRRTPRWWTRATSPTTGTGPVSRGSAHLPAVVHLTGAAGGRRAAAPGTTRRRGVAHDADPAADLGAFPGHRRADADPRGYPRPVGEHPLLPERGSPHPQAGPGFRPLTLTGGSPGRCCRATAARRLAPDSVGGRCNPARRPTATAGRRASGDEFTQLLRSAVMPEGRSMSRTRIQRPSD